MEKRIRTDQTGTKPVESAQHHQKLPPTSSGSVGGYASGPTLKTAGMMGVPTLIQEQNSYAGVTNKLLAQKAKAICVAYDGMEKFFPADKIIMTGNPVRQNLTKDMPEKGAALRSFNLQPDKKTILIVGGSLAHVPLTIR